MSNSNIKSPSCRADGLCIVSIACKYSPFLLKLYLEKLIITCILLELYLENI